MNCNIVNISFVIPFVIPFVIRNVTGALLKLNDQFVQNYLQNSFCFQCQLRDILFESRKYLKEIIVLNGLKSHG